MKPTQTAKSVFIVVVLVLCSLSARISTAQDASPSDVVHFVPNSQTFWDFSKNWTTNLGPAYRDVVAASTNFLPCSGQYAFCFVSGPEPLPCKLSADGRFADCTCTVQSGLNFVDINSILNEKVYQDTVSVCGTDGSNCSRVIDKAPVCKGVHDASLIPGADLISDFSPGFKSSLTRLTQTADTASSFTICPKAPYAGCMTAPCKLTEGGNAECSCPVFWGLFQLTGSDAQCSLGDDLVWSASYIPQLDRLP